MKSFMPERERVEIIACFGEARLVRGLDLKYELEGGSAEDRVEAQQWIRLYCPDLVHLCGE